MTSKLTRDAYAALIAEDIAWLEARTSSGSLEHRHIVTVLRQSIESEYPSSPAPDDAAPNASRWSYRGSLGGWLWDCECPGCPELHTPTEGRCSRCGTLRPTPTDAVFADAVIRLRRTAAEWDALRREHGR